MKDYIEDIEDKDYFWKVILRNKKTNQPITWMNVTKDEFPTKHEAINYVVEQHDNERDLTMKEISELRMKSTPYRMMESTDRKKKTIKPKSKRKCRCKK